MPLIVSVTPLAVDRDSRTFKQAASVARLGYDSLVVERYPSRLGTDVAPFRLRSVEDAGGRDARRAGRGAILARWGAWLGRLALHLPGAKYAMDRVYWLGLRTFWAIPAASAYYLHAFYQFPAVQLRCWLHGARFVYDAHDLYTLDDDGPSTSWRYRYLRVPFERWLERHCLRRAAAVVTVSDGIAEVHHRRFGRRPIVIRNCDDRRLHHPPARTIRAAAGIGSADFLFVVVGNAKKGQGLLPLLEAAARTPPRVHLALLGAGYEAFRPAIEARGLAVRVHVLAPVRPFEVVPFIAEADASVMVYYARSANYRHCLPNGFFQAISAGLPLLYPDLPELAALAAAHGLGIPIDPLSPDSLAAGMRTFVEQPGRLEDFRRNAARAREIVCWQHEEQVLAGVLDRVAGGARADGRG
jgi:glycosyltransferase involved in cell wall biosynthesis